MVDAGDVADRNALIAAHLDRLEAGLAQPGRRSTRCATCCSRRRTRRRSSTAASRPSARPASRRSSATPSILAWWQGALASCGPPSGRRACGPPASGRGVRQRAVPARARPGDRVHPGRGPGRRRGAGHRAGHAGHHPGRRDGRHQPPGPPQRRRSQLRRTRLVRHQARDQRGRARRASTTCAARATRPTRRNGGRRLAGPSSAPTGPVTPGEPVAEIPAPRVARRFAGIVCPPGISQDHRAERVMREFGLMLGSLPPAARKALAVALAAVEQGARLYRPARDGGSPGSTTGPRPPTCGRCWRGRTRWRS